MASRKKLTTNALHRASALLACAQDLAQLVMQDLPPQYCAGVTAAHTLLSGNRVDVEALLRGPSDTTKARAPRAKKPTTPTTTALPLTDEGGR